jgi:hypothetical protein
MVSKQSNVGVIFAFFEKLQKDEFFKKNIFGLLALTPALFILIGNIITSQNLINYGIFEYSVISNKALIAGMCFFIINFGFLVLWFTFIWLELDKTCYLLINSIVKPLVYIFFLKIWGTKNILIVLTYLYSISFSCFFVVKSIRSVKKDLDVSFESDIRVKDVFFGQLLAISFVPIFLIFWAWMYSFLVYPNIGESFGGGYRDKSIITDNYNNKFEGTIIHYSSCCVYFLEKESYETRSIKIEDIKTIKVENQNPFIGAGIRH